MNSPESSALACDFARSFIRWRNDTTKKAMLTASQPPPTSLNNVRMALECLATVTRGGRQTEFGLGTSCKTENVFVERDIWTKPNADMCAVSSSDQFMIVKQWDKVDKGVMLYPPSLGPQPPRQSIDPKLAFETHSLALRRRAVRRIDAIEETINLLLSDREMLCRTTFAIEGGEITIEYPVKTVNFSERHRYYQVDTGPVLFFDEPTGQSLIEHLHLAYVAHLGADWAEFIISAPTPLEGHSVSVQHFSRIRRVTSRNTLWLVEGA